MYLSINTVKPVLSGHSKLDNTKTLKTNGAIMKVESIAEHSAILLACQSDNRSCKSILSGRLRQVLL